MQVSGGNVDTAGDDLYRALADGVAGLGERDILAAAELAPAGITVWTVRRDRSGTPRAAGSPQAPWASLYSDSGGLDEDELRRITWAGRASRLMLVGSPADGPDAARALSLLRAADPAPTILPAAVAVRDLIPRAIAESPLTLMYELVVMQRARSGEVTLGLCPLFSRDSRRRSRRPFAIRCEPSDELGTVFAVVATEPPRRFSIVSAQSVKLAPGPYHLTAELQGPGRVQFHGLPELSEDRRSWSELVAAVPDRLPPLEAAHLICAVEACGPAKQVEERVLRVQQLIQLVSGRGDDRLSVSVIAYGPHAVIRGEPDVPPKVITWAGTGDAAERALSGLSGQGPEMTGYSGAAQLECALAEVGRRLARDQEGGRPIVVAAGSRPPFPPRVDARLGILPCPYRSDWAEILQRLRGHPGISFGAIHDQEPTGIWSELGQAAFADGNAADLTDFAVGLRLLTPGARHVPLPIVDLEGG